MQSVASSSAALDPVAEFVKRAKPQDCRAFLELILGGYLRIVLFVALAAWFPGPLTFILAFFVVTSGMGVLIHLSHESQHSALLRNKRWNDWVGAWLCAYPLGSIYGASRAVHMAHHKYLNTSVDPDRHFHIEQDKSTPGAFLWYLVRLLLGGQLWTSIVVNGFLRGRAGTASSDSAEAKVVLLPRRRYPEVFNLVPVQAIIFALFWVGTGKWWMYFALWLLPIFTLGTLLGYIRGFIDHARLASDDEEKSEGRLISVPRPSLVDQMFFTGLDFHFHAEHHFFPSVPHYYLPRLHKLLQADPRYRNRYLLRPSYTSFLAEYWRQICRGQKSRNTERAPGEVQQWGKPKPKVLFIMPRMPQSFWGMEYSAPYCGFRYPNPPLGLMTLAGAISPDYEVEIRDENVEKVDYHTDADIVGISGMLLSNYHVDRLIELADFFRSMGKVVCVGGPVANLAPETVKDHCDVLFEGEGELTWPQFLRDYENGSYSNYYAQVEKVDLMHAPIPRVDLVKAEHYGAGMIQTTRGCPFTCEFCDIIVMYGRKVRTKPIETVLREVELWADAGTELIFFSDDNFVGNRPYAKELLRALVAFNSKRAHPIYFYTQASIDTARDRELMELLRDANFAGIFIGIESPRKSSLSETMKVQNVHTSDLDEAIHTIQSYGLWVSGGMIVGFDHDDKDIFDEQFQFLQRTGVVFAQMSLLEAMPKTPLWERMKANGRLLEYRRGLATNISPLNLTYQELVNGYTDLIRRVYSYDAYRDRYLTSLRYMKGHTFPNDRPPRKWSHYLNLIRICAYYLCTLESQRRRFFFDMMKGTFSINPYAWRWTVRYLANFIHFHQYAQKHVWVVMAPMTEQVLHEAKAS